MQWAEGETRHSGGGGGGGDQSGTMGKASLPPLLAHSLANKKMAPGVPAREAKAKHNDTASHMLRFSVTVSSFYVA